jgi:hypothetical protein
VLSAPSPIKYNATVVAVQNFKADEDVDTLKQSLGNYTWKYCLLINFICLYWIAFCGTCPKIRDERSVIHFFVGNDENDIITILTTRSRNQREEICSKYEKKYQEVRFIIRLPLILNHWFNYLL